MPTLCDRTQRPTCSGAGPALPRGGSGPRAPLNTGVRGEPRRGTGPCAPRRSRPGAPAARGHPPGPPGPWGRGRCCRGSPAPPAPASPASHGRGRPRPLLLFPEPCAFGSPHSPAPTGIRRAGLTGGCHRRVSPLPRSRPEPLPWRRPPSPDRPEARCWRKGPASRRRAGPRGRVPPARRSPAPGAAPGGRLLRNGSPVGAAGLPGRCPPCRRAPEPEPPAGCCRSDGTGSVRPARAGGAFGPGSVTSTATPTARSLGFVALFLLRFCCLLMVRCWGAVSQRLPLEKAETTDCQQQQMLGPSREGRRQL